MTEEDYIAAQKKIEECKNILLDCIDTLQNFSNIYLDKNGDLSKKIEMHRILTEAFSDDFITILCNIRTV